MQPTRSPVPWPVQDFPAGALGPGSDAADDSAGFDHSSVLSTSMLDELRELNGRGEGGDVVEVVAACLRLKEPTWLAIRTGGWVWPLTVLPALGLYRAPIDWSAAPPSGLHDAQLLECEPAEAPLLPRGGRLPAALPCHYALDGLTWTLALDGPRSTLLHAIGGRRRFRVASDGPRLRVAGALGSAVGRLQNEAASFDEIACWPGLGPARASRLLNGLYLASQLRVSRLAS